VRVVFARRPHAACHREVEVEGEGEGGAARATRGRGTQCRMPAFVRSRPRATCSKGRRFGGEPGRMGSCSATGSSPARHHSPAGTAHTAQLQGDNWRMRRAGQSTLSVVKVGECLEIKAVLESARPAASGAGDYSRRLPGTPPGGEAKGRRPQKGTEPLKRAPPPRTCAEKLSWAAAPRRGKSAPGAPARPFFMSGVLSSRRR